MKAFRDFYPTVGLPDDMVAMLPKSGTRAMVYAVPSPQPPSLLGWQALALLPAAPPSPQHTLQKRFQAAGKGESFRGWGCLGAQGPQGLGAAGGSDSPGRPSLTAVFLPTDTCSSGDKEAP